MLDCFLCDVSRWGMPKNSICNQTTKENNNTSYYLYVESHIIWFRGALVKI